MTKERVLRLTLFEVEKFADLMVTAKLYGMGGWITGTIIQTPLWIELEEEYTSKW
jgi:hypothetical protein